MKGRVRWNLSRRLLAPLVIVASALAGGVREPEVPHRRCVAEQQASQRPERLYAVCSPPASPRHE